MKLHASTDDKGVTRFMIEHEDGSRTTFQAYVTDAELNWDYDAMLDGFTTRHVPRMSTTTFNMSVGVLGDVIRTSAYPHPATPELP